jgi:CDGSH-type Zn-finger protein
VFEAYNPAGVGSRTVAPHPRRLAAMPKDDFRVRISEDGPYELVGSPPLVRTAQVETEFGEPIGWEEPTPIDPRGATDLCRCGASSRKPFCDGSHIGIGFSDARRPGHVPDEVPDSRGAAGVVNPSIRIARNGPYEVQGFDLDIEAWKEGALRERFSLCRCGGSKNKPFCDGTHRSIGFQDDRN